MELLKRSLTTALFCVFLLPVFAQPEAKLITAFSESYYFETQKNYQRALEVMQKVYANNSYEINLRLGWLYYKLENNANAAKYYKTAVDIMPYSEEAKLGLVNALGALNQWDQVIEQYKKILSLHPQNTQVNYNLGLIYYNRANYQTAYKHFETVVNLYPFSYDGLLMFAWTNLKLGKTTEARALFNKVLLYAPGDASAKEGLELLKN